MAFNNLSIQVPIIEENKMQSLDVLAKRRGQLHIGIDIDNTLVQLPVIQRINREFNTRYTEADLNDWSLSNFPEAIQEFIFDLHVDPHFMCVESKAAPGTRDVLIKWKTKGHKLYAISKRDPILAEATMTQFDQEFYGLFSDIEFVKKSTTKMDSLKKFGIDVYMDDYEVEDALALGLKTFLITNDQTHYNWHKRANTKLNQAAYIRHVHIEDFR